MRQRPSAWARAREKASRGEAWGGCLAFLAVAAALIGFALTVMTLGTDLWGSAAPAWPGGGYGFAAVVGAAGPLGLATVIAALSRTRWKTNPLRSLGRVLASLPGVAASFVWVVVVFAGFRPRHRRDWGSGCHSRGNPCWVHVEYPWVWAVGLLSTVLATAVLFTVLFRIDKARRSAAAA
ncbi:hypothetical protein [Streptomyces sp. NPDC001914]|uniref:hypothetical protein n=1 Tax=Streptomyces sp. NPDC001914 TaxID=3364623 RepID=UPI0036A79CDA